MTEPHPSGPGWRGIRAVGAVAAIAAATLLCAGPALAQAEPAVCVEPGAAVRLDHVTVAVSDLARAADTFRSHGFRLKRGPVHSNGIHNLHAKFEDGTELELLGVDRASDELAKWYEDFIASGGGGAFLALAAGPVESVAALLRPHGMTPLITSGGGFEYASFPTDHELHHVYFIEYRVAPDDPLEILEHGNQAVALREAWIEVVAGTSLPAALHALGARSCGVVRHPAGFEGEAIGLANGRVILVSRAREPVHSRVLAVTLLGHGSAPYRLIPAAAAEGVWIRIVPEREGGAAP